MAWLLRDEFWRWKILDTWEESDDLTVRDFSGTGSALSFLQSLQGDRHCMATLRTVVAERFNCSGSSKLDDPYVLDLVAGALETGRLRVAEEFRRSSLTVRAQAPVESEVGGTPFAPTPTPEPEKTWIEIELVGEDDKPIQFERYLITLPDGRSVARGMLDERGFAHVAGSKKGTWIVSFPDLDKEAWEKI